MPQKYAILSRNMRHKQGPLNAIKDFSIDAVSYRKLETQLGFWCCLVCFQTMNRDDKEVSRGSSDRHLLVFIYRFAGTMKFKMTSALVRN